MIEVHQIAIEHLRRGINERRELVKAIETRGEPTPLELLVEIDAFQREIIRLGGLNTDKEIAPRISRTSTISSN